MKQKTLNDLIKAHNILYRLSVPGSQVIPMASVLVTLQSIINEYAAETQPDSAEGDCEVHVDE